METTIPKSERKPAISSEEIDRRIMENWVRCHAEELEELENLRKHPKICDPRKGEGIEMIPIE
ncbi:MAG: hypothetical protein L6Q54_12985 [Leptospiraceae bacterium]|nr:hypothetical protein [Leptospiraceae bacterium]MCK6382149.1 hypothetical protein [Leptospiraceae bacterium]NUM40430.1 hypothetical protein [Leptospiraceae bacterium]